MQLNLEKMIDKAFLARERNDFNDAVIYLKAVLAQTEDVLLKGMIYIELVFAYRELGRYLEAAGLVEGYLRNSAPSLSPSLYNHFKCLVLHLQTIDMLLKKADSAELPYAQVPRLIKIRAEKVFKEMATIQSREGSTVQ